MAPARLAVFLVAIGLGGWPSAGRAMTAWGTLITNVATITMNSGFPDFVDYAISYNMTCRVFIGSPATMRVLKTVNPTVQAPGGTLSYTIWLVNTSPTSSSFNIVATDVLPANVAFDALRGSWDGGSGGTWSAAYSSNNVTYANGVPATGQTAPYYLRFMLTQIGPARSAAMVFSATVL